MTVKKNYDLAALGSIGWDFPELVSRLVEDGRNDLLEKLPPRPSGLGAHGLPPALSLLPDSRVAIGGLVGEEDHSRLMAELAHGGIDTDCVFSVPNARTRQQRVALAPDGKRLITRLPGGVSIEVDRTLQHMRRWKGMFARARAGVLAHLPPDLTHELLDWCERLQTFAALVPGTMQFAEVPAYRPNLLVVNIAEAAEASNVGPGEPPEQVFCRLLALTQAPLVAMTGGGTNPTFFADRRRGLRGTAWPAALDRIARPTDVPPTGLGAGDVFACVLTRCLALGQAIEEAVGWARLYATAHVCGERFRTRPQLEAWSAANKHTFPAIDTADLPRIAA